MHDMFVWVALWRKKPCHQKSTSTVHHDPGAIDHDSPYLGGGGELALVGTEVRHGGLAKQNIGLDGLED